ncbi:Hypothetical protein SRAE_1000328600 [Strongyloides ratti]|uniref:Uncharacterized protein n=1 Tax=Strongyloides ratti TaxID=34506 RepID=A0A090LA66_STRRB|nr:Hypothetical protein SRAE_1000328600 [Strongyloides ratti]CEF65033.1 Hypothetical protein SRAE_1000328600 [Strongyloides ratti]
MIQILIKKRNFFRNFFEARKCFIQTEAVGIENILLKEVEISEDESLKKLDFLNIDAKFLKNKLNISNKGKIDSVTTFCNIFSDVEKNLSISSQTFINNFLIPLEKDERKFIDFIRCDESKMNFLISLCGKLMTDVNRNDRIYILKRLCKSFKSHDFEFTLTTINTILKVLEENNEHFDVETILTNLEVKRNLVPDVEFLKYMMYHYAKCGLLDDLKQLKEKFVEKNIISCKEFELAMIRCLSVKKKDTECDVLINSFNEKYDKASNFEALSQAIVGSSQQVNLPRITCLLHKALIFDVKYDKMQLFYELPNEVIMDVIWNLEEMSLPADKISARNAIDNILNIIESSTFPSIILTKECERHISEGHYHIAVKFIKCLYNREKLKNPQSDFYFNDYLIKQIIQRMIVNNVDITEVKSIAYQLAVSIENKFIVFREIIHHILTYKEYKDYERFEKFISFIDEIDPCRERYHLIYPFLASENDVRKKLTILFMFKSTGYHDLTKLNFELVYKYIINQIIFYGVTKERFKTKKYNIFEQMSMIFSSYQISNNEIYYWMNKLKKYAQRNKTHRDNIFFKESLSEWLYKNYKQKYFLESTNDMKGKDLKIILKDCIKQKNLIKIHEIMNKKSTYQVIKVNSYIDKILEIYLQHGSWDELITFLKNASNYSTLIDKTTISLSHEQIFKILEMFTESSKKFDELINIIYYLKMKFPITHSNGINNWNLLKRARKLIQLKTVETKSNKKIIVENQIYIVVLAELLNNLFIKCSNEKYEISNHGAISCK